MKFNPVIVDLSHHDDVQDWNAVKAFGILGVINKATEGLGVVDKTYAVRRKPASDRGILYGAYHFLRPGDPIAQADQFLKVALKVANPDEILLALDHEDRRVKLDKAKQFLQRVLDKTGRRAVLYSGFLIKEQLGRRHDAFLAEHRLWLSHFSTKPKCPPNWEAPWIIQFTGDGVGPQPHQVPGIRIPGGIDLNHYGGTPEQLKAEWAKGPVTATPRLPGRPQPDARPVPIS
jgi:GH25 family lysozyme M1 (1,4-beta-N-acetylmuramidase)